MGEGRGVGGVEEWGGEGCGRGRRVGGVKEWEG